MKKLNKKAFTLIELLVVVLIIAILAAIALPQYFITVEKSRASEALTILGSIASAEERYYLATDGVTNDFGNFDIEIMDYVGVAADGVLFNSDNFKYSLTDCSGGGGGAGFGSCTIMATRMESTNTFHSTYDYIITRDVSSGDVTCDVHGSGGGSGSKGAKICAALGM